MGKHPHRIRASKHKNHKTVAKPQLLNRPPRARVPGAVLEAVEFLVSSVESLASVEEEEELWEEKNLCVECGEDMGPQNPRQLCGKWRCTNAEW